MKYGFFDNENKEFVIKRPDTPTPWINYLGSHEYCAMISNTAGGYSFHKDPRDKRVTRYRYNSLPYDRPGRYIYLRDDDKKDFWSCSWQPVTKDLKEFQYSCRHGLGYTKINAGYKDIETEVTYFVPLSDNLEVWILSVKNNSNKRRNLSVFSYVEFCLWQAVADMNDFQYTLNIARAHCKDNIIYHSTGYYPEIGLTNLAYFSVNKKITGYDCDRETFIGKYRDESNPIAVEDGSSFNSRASGGNPIGSHHIKLHLAANEKKDIIFVLGTEDNYEKIKKQAKKYSSSANCFKEFERLKEYWHDYLEKFYVESPDEDINTLVNIWNAYQCRTTFNWSRSASFYETGIGRGMGFRDSNQDTLGALHAVGPEVKTRIKDLAANQFKDGSAFHQYFPLTKKGDKAGYSDDHLWLIVSTANYIKETGDYGFLKEKVAFVEGTKDTMYQHLKKAIDYSFKNIGKHKLPLLGFADWNDCLNNTGKNSESVWVAQLLCFAAKEMQKLCIATGKTKDAAYFKNVYEKVGHIINSVAWDGNWYIRMFDGKGRPIGSNKNKEGKIYLNTQSWAVMADIAPADRLKECMDMVKKYLDSKHGIMLMGPAYSTFDPNVGAIGTFARGLKENGGIFCHANPWAVIAETKLGRGDRAFTYYKKTAPTTRNKIADTHKTEGYIYSQFIAGSDHPEFGRARNSWLTGSASWNFIAATWYILGIRPDYNGLVVDPCIPSDWRGFKVTRIFRGARYQIEIENPKRVSKGIKKITVDGKVISQKTLPIFKDKKTHKVEVLMG